MRRDATIRRQMRVNGIGALLSILILTAPLPCQADEPAKGAGYALTIYSSADAGSFDPRIYLDAASYTAATIPGFGVVKETRKIALEKGENVVRVSDVAAGIDPTTVAFKSRTAPGSTTVLEQDYEFDLVGSEKILERYLGQSIQVSQKGGEPVQATLLAAEGGTLVLQNPASGGLNLIPRGGADGPQINLPKLPKGLITRPTLVWRVETDRPGEHDAEIAYQTSGMTWRADYNLVVNKESTKADLGAWVSILNRSGASYADARLKLVAGDVQRVQPAMGSGLRGGAMAAPMAKADTGFQEKSFSDYHMYTLGRSTSLADRSTKQIELFPARSGITVRKEYVYNALPQYRGYRPNAPDQNPWAGGQGNKKVDVELVLKNSEAAGLGLPLPAGRVRVYERDEADSALEFIGEDTIDHTAKNEDLRVQIGSAFDVVAERTPTQFLPEIQGRSIVETIQITVRNRKTAPVTVLVNERLYRWSGWTITQESQPHEAVDAHTVRWPVAVPADGSKIVTYTVRYLW